MELAKTTAEQRGEIYDDVRSLIVPGFLAHPVRVGEMRFVLRSLDQADWSLLQFRTHGESARGWKVWVVATSTWMINGILVGSDEDALQEIAAVVRSLPPNVTEILSSVVNGLMRRVQAAADLVEAFLYEDESRHLWRTESAGILERRLARGFQRFFNPVISLWTYYNQMEDLRETEDREWHHTRFLAGPHAPKGVKKIIAQDRKRDADLKRQRDQVRNRLYYQAIGLLAKPEDKEGAAGTRAQFGQVVMAETEEELRESMRRWVEGIKDDHDHVVDNVKAKIKYDVKKREEDNRKRREALDRALEDEGLTRSQLTPLAGEAGRKFLERMHARMPGASVVIDDNTHNSAYKKYIERNPEVGDLHVDEEGNIKSLQTVSEDMLEVLTKPEREQSLQDQIAARRPTATFVGDEEEG